MSQQSMSRSQRARGSRAKRIFQVTVLLAVVVWLLYQTKHAYDKKPEYAEAEYTKLSKGDMNIQFGRKVNAGSENVINIDPHGKNSDETMDAGETGKIGVNQDVIGDEEKAKEGRHESEESREDTIDSGKEEALHGQGGNVDDNVNPHNVSTVSTEGMQDGLRLTRQRSGGSFDRNEKRTEDVEARHESEDSREDISDSGKEDALQEQEVNVDDNVGHHKLSKVNTEGVQDGLRLPSQRDSGNFDQNEKQTEDVNSTEENGLPNGDATTSDGSNIIDKDKIKGDEAMLSTANLAENGDNTEQQSEMGKSGSEHSDSAVHASQELTNSSVSDDQSNRDLSVDRDSQEEIVTSQEASGSDAEITSNNTIVEAGTNARSDAESRVTSDLHEEIAVNSSAEAAYPDRRSEVGSDNFPKSVDENNVVMPDSNGVPGGEEGELQSEIILEGQATGIFSFEDVPADTIDDAPADIEENHMVMPDNNGVPKEEVVQPQMDRVSEGEKADINSSEEAKTDKSDSEALEKKTDASDVEATTAVTVEKENDRKLIDEAANSAFTSNEEHAELPENNEVQSQGNTVSDAENTSKSSLEEQSDKFLAKSVQNNEEVASHEDDTFKVESASQYFEDATGEVESQSNNRTAPVSGNNHELSSGNRTAEGQEVRAGSESSEL